MITKRRRRRMIGKLKAAFLIGLRSGDAGPLDIEELKSSARRRFAADALVSYSLGLLGRDEAIRRIGLRDYAALLVALGDADLPMPLPPQREIEKQAETFVALWNQDVRILEKHGLAFPRDRKPVPPGSYHDLDHDLTGDDDDSR